ncbi:hypothetical protein ZEAMMB73_Zm00001d000335 [Zea mays]|jgi:hypothetical protein|nr:hypothetical protein ZEAMMB73_Zm00001d000335 [Zea mays]
MAADDHVFRATNEASVALLRGLRAGTVDKAFIHNVDVYTAAPEELVAGLEPVPGTDVTEDGYNRQWYLYCPKRYKNGVGRASGHRLRAVETAGTCWHSETGPKPVEGLPGATFCSLSYGRKEKEDEGTSGRHRHRFDRMGWHMTEYDDTQGGGGDHVLCKVHRSSSSLAKKKCNTKRTATGDHPEAPPTKVIRDVQVQQMQDPAGAIFTGATAYPTMDDPRMVGGELGKSNVDYLLNINNVDGEQQQQQQPCAEPSSDVQVQVDPAATLMPSYVHGHQQGGDPLMAGGKEEQSRRVESPEAELDYFDDWLNNVDWKGFLEILGDNEEQGLPLQQQPCIEPAEQSSDVQVQVDPAATLMPCYVHGHEQGGDPLMAGGEEEQSRRIESAVAELDYFDDWLNNVYRKGFLEILRDYEEQGLPLQQQPCVEPAEQSSDVQVQVVPAATLMLGDHEEQGLPQQQQPCAEPAAEQSQSSRTVPSV